MESNPQLELAYDFLEYTGVNVFLTGKAGTGKKCAGSRHCLYNMWAGILNRKNP